MASAPAATAARASSTRVIPQILLRTRAIFHAPGYSSASHLISGAHAAACSNASAPVHILQSREKMWPQVTLRQGELLGILHVHQVQAVGVRGHSSIAPVATGQHLLDPDYWTLPGTNSHKHPSHITHHVVEEGIGSHIQHNEAALLQNRKVLDGLDGGLGLALCRQEC